MIRPLADRIVVEPIDRQASQSIAVILVERPNLGRVVAVGCGKYDKRGRLQPMDCSVGDTVRFGEFDFPTYTEPQTLKKYFILQEADIAGIVEH